ncbi:hypothetical protein QJS04_geneDACA011817 [Acorus gramineus]|uniref:Uncharacterized protein n=1 Tax=Acorus gramineus TaxID=55184 RepID=A0AAV9BJZ6_ACOGR|nr:hypothetical protein QJS04_geneDACA011817 [Acorus gramineus]
MDLYKDPISKVYEATFRIQIEQSLGLGEIWAEFEVDGEKAVAHKGVFLDAFLDEGGVVSGFGDRFRTALYIH